jgi:hypothetical protein
MHPALLRDTKTCNKCHTPKPLDQFHRHNRDGVRTRCIQCHLEDGRERRAAIARLRPPKPIKPVKPPKPPRPPSEPGFKTCNDCGETKPISSDFYIVTKNKDGTPRAHSYCKQCLSTRNKRWTVANPERTRDNVLKWKFGISAAEYDERLQNQNGVCKICSKPNPDGKALAVDHCHGYGKVRGLLCSNCNTAIGLLKDDWVLLRKAAKYLVDHYEEHG